MAPGPQPATSRAVTVTALRWEPGSPLAAGAMAGWLMTLHVMFDNVQGMGETTVLRIGKQICRPGDWVLECGGQVLVVNPEVHAELFEKGPAA